MFIACIFLTYFLEFCDESVTYSELKLRDSSNIQKRKLTRIWKAKGKKCKTLDSFFCLHILMRSHENKRTNLSNGNHPSYTFKQVIRTQSLVFRANGNEQ